MNWKLLSALALAGSCIVDVPAGAQAAGCEVHVYPADGVYSVGEDFDAVHQVDQDLRHYYQTAGRSLDWLTPRRQLELLSEMPLVELAGAPIGSKVMHPEPLSRHRALEPGPHEPADGCVTEIMLPQIMLERGGLATRSLRLFGVVRRYESGTLVSGYSGFAAAPMTGFQLKTAADGLAATAIVEEAYRTAVRTLLSNASKPSKK